jgi:hypothetical protein
MHDHTRTLTAVKIRPWEIVMLRSRDKKPAGANWQVSRDADEIERHLEHGGNLGLVAHERTGLAIIDPDELLCWADMIDTLGQPCAPWVETGRGR